MRWAPGHDECRHHGHAPALPPSSPLELKLTLNDGGGEGALEPSDRYSDSAIKTALLRQGSR